MRLMKTSTATVCAAGLTFACAASAAPVFSLSSATPGLNALRVGDAVMIDVVLSGLAAGDTLDFAAATVEFDGTLLGTPLITAGGVIPDESGFLGTGDAGLADGSFDALFLPPAAQTSSPPTASSSHWR